MASAYPKFANPQFRNNDSETAVETRASRERPGTAERRTHDPAGRRSLTRQQHVVLQFMLAYLDQHGFPPTLEEIADRLGVTRVTVWEHVHAMEADGFVRIERYRRRGAMPCSRCPTCGRAWERASQAGESLIGGTPGDECRFASTSVQMRPFRELDSDSPVKGCETRTSRPYETKHRL